MMRKIGIQGIKGSYHDQVAKEYFGDAVEINEFLSFDELADSVFIG
ncbi:prephenate dehydratase, partial [Flavobacteriaceae bacterium]|nr:prephenate dehydratase [Flavobacteriaceae bacterium]